MNGAFSSLIAAGLLGLLVATSSCNTCTLVGCNEGIWLRLRAADGGAVGAFSGTATWDGGSQSFTCGPAGDPGQAGECSASSVFLRASPPPRELDVDISEPADAGHFSGRVSLPEHTVSYPNGPECGPACLGGSAELQLQAR